MTKLGQPYKCEECGKLNWSNIDCACAYNGSVAYNAYCDAVNWSSPITGDKLPCFNKLPEIIQNAWNRAAMAVTSQRT